MNNMTGDPHQESRPSVLGLEPYPLNLEPIDWSRVPMQPPVIPSGQFSSSFNYQPSVSGLGNFSFCSTQTPHPAQFPFPSSSTASSFGNSFLASSAPPMRCKRKTESPPLQTYKQHITEEKMAEHMARLHISSETAGSSKESDSERTRRLYMCEEMRKLQSEAILPLSLLHRIQRPCTALVLWTPPPRLMAPDENNGNNNEDSVPDHNQMVSDDIVESEMDMDNV